MEAQQLEQIVPHNLEAEQALLGCILLDAATIMQVSVMPDDFYIHRNRFVFEAMRALVRRKVGVDLVTLSEELSIRNQLAEIGGVAYLSELVSRSPSSLGAGDYASIIKDKSERRRLIQAANDIAKIAYDEARDLTETIPPVLDDISLSVRPNDEAVHVSELLPGLIDEVVARSENPQAVWGIPFGLLDLDKCLGGLQLSEIFMLAGPPGIGKTILAAQLCRNFADHAPGAIFSLEMQERQLLRRSISAEAQITTRDMKSGDMAENWDQFYGAVETWTQLPIYLSDNPAMSTIELRAELWRLKMKHDIKWAMVDYLHLLTDAEGRLDETQQSALISRRLKAIARSLDIGLLVVNSVVKESMDSKMPNQKDARGSGQVIHDVDILAFLKKDDRAEMRTLFIAKAREAGTRRIPLLLRPNFPLFVDVATQQIDLNAVAGGKQKDNGGKVYDYLHE